MPIKLEPNEIAFYPQPFVESEANLLVITNRRVVQFGESGHQQIAAREVSHLGRVSERPLLPVGLVLAVIGLPLLIIGAYLFLSVRGLSLPAVPGVPGAPPAAPANVADDPSGAPAANPDDPSAAPAAVAAPGDPADTRTTGIVLGAVGVLLLAGGALALRKERHFVMVRGGTQVMKIQATDKMQQNQILMTVQAAQSGARAGSGPAAAKPAAAKVEVDDKGDPVKALQDLAMARQTGKVSDDEFQAKREVLLERINKRK